MARRRHHRQRPHRHRRRGDTRHHAYLPDHGHRPAGHRHDHRAGMMMADSPRKPPGPVIDYLARDYASLRQALLDRLSLTMPGWAERHLPDAGIALVELLAYAGD